MFGMILTLSSCYLGDPRNINNNNVTPKEKVATPTFSVEAGSFNVDQEVELSCTTTGTTIYYTIDGSEPTSASDVYSAPIIVSGNETVETIKAFAIKSGMDDSDVASATYTINYLQAAAPTISPSSGAVANGTEVTLTTATTGAEIRYTINGVDPDGSSSLYNPSSKPTVTTAITFKARAIKSGYTSSIVSSASYTIIIPAGTQATFSGNGVPFKMVYVPGGLTFKAGLSDDTPTTVANAYWIGETSVTYELWNTVKAWATDAARGANIYSFINAGVMGKSGTGSAQQPVTTINWRDAMIWTNALTELYNANNGTDPDYTCAYYTDAAYTTPIRTSTAAAINMTAGTQDAPYVKADATGFRMMASSEYELAARYKGADSSNGAYQWPAASGKWWTPGTYASGATADYTNATPTGLVSWNSANSGTTTHDVKGKAANSLLLYDMSGNVSEWSFDWSTVGSSRAVRGGSWFNAALGMQIGNENSSDPSLSLNRLGFRFVRTAQ